MIPHLIFNSNIFKVSVDSFVGFGVSCTYGSLASVTPTEDLVEVDGRMKNIVPEPLLDC